MDRALTALGIISGLDEVERAGLLEQTIAQLAHVLRSVNLADRATLARLALNRAADPSTGLFTIPQSLADLAASVAITLLPQAPRDSRPLKAFDPCLGCGEVSSRLLEEHRKSSSAPLEISGNEQSPEKFALAEATLALANANVSSLRNTDWLLESDGLYTEFDYLVTAIEASSWSHLEPYIAHRFPSLPRSSDSTLIYLTKITQSLADARDSIAVAIVNSAALTIGGPSSGDVRLRRWILETGLVYGVVALPSNLLAGTSLAPTLLILRSSSAGGTSESVRFVDARSLGKQQDRRGRSLSDEDIISITVALQDEKHPLRGDVSVSQIAEDARWRIPSFAFDTRGPRSGLNEDRLDALCEILPGRNRKTDKVSDVGKVIPASAISNDLAPWSELPHSDALRTSSVWVQPGDVIGSISPPHGRWVLVPDDYPPALASDHTVVLRSRGNVSVRFLVGYLRSDTGKAYLSRMFRGTIPRLDRDQLARLPVPQCPLDAVYLDSILENYSSELQRLESEIGLLRNRLDNVYKGDSPIEIAADVDALHGVTASLRSINDLNSALRIARTSYPYPISRTLRAIERTQSPRERYHEIVHQGLETIATVLAAVCAAISRDQALTGKAVKNWCGQVSRNGATIGAQRSMFIEVARLIQTSGSGTSDLGGIGSALGDANSPAVGLLDSLIAERNRIHGDYPKSDFEFRSRLLEYEQVMQKLLDRLSFLARWELRYAQSIEPVEHEDGYPEYNGQFALLRGDNPDWVLAERVSATPLYRGRVYALVDGSTLLDLYPFLLVQDCPQCGAKEVYYPDSFNADEAKLKSLDRGHPQSCTEPRILRDLGKAFMCLSNA